MIKGTIELDEKALEEAVKMFVLSQYGLKSTYVSFKHATYDGSTEYSAVATYVPISKTKAPSTSDYNCK